MDSTARLAQRYALQPVLLSAVTGMTVSALRVKRRITVTSATNVIVTANYVHPSPIVHHVTVDTTAPSAPTGVHMGVPKPIVRKQTVHVEAVKLVTMESIAVPLAHMELAVVKCALNIAQNAHRTWCVRSVIHHIME